VNIEEGFSILNLLGDKNASMKNVSHITQNTMIFILFIYKTKLNAMENFNALEKIVIINGVAIQLGFFISKAV